MTDFINNPNDHFTYNHAFDKTFRNSPAPKEGKVVNVSRENHLSQTYDVELLVTGAIIKGCRLLSSNGGFNGIGSYKSLEEGTPVLLGFNDGSLQEGYIVGVFYVEGSNDSYYKEGKVQKPGETLNGFEFNQPSGHPNRIVQPDAYFNITGGKNLASEYSSPEFYNEDIEEKSKNNPVPASIEMRNPLGDVVTYSSGANITYSDSNIVTVSAGNTESKPDKLLRFAAYHNKRGRIFSGRGLKKPTAIEAVKATPGLKSIVEEVIVNTNRSSLRSPFEFDYFAKQEQKLADLYLQQAQKQIQADAARANVVNQLQELGSELPNSLIVKGNVTEPNYKPKETKVNTDPNNFGERLNPKHKPLIVLHESDVTAAMTIEIFQNPKREVSYHRFIKLNGEIINFVDSKKRAYGAAPSQFNGESEVTTPGGKPSVNNFSFHVSFETPASGLGAGSNNNTHTGYTEAQYMSAAYIISRCGVPLERITTHKYVDLGQGKRDPRSFDRAKFEKILNSFPKRKEIYFDIPGEEDYIKTLISKNPVSVTSETKVTTATPSKFPKSTLEIYKERYNAAFSNSYKGTKPSKEEWIRLFSKEKEVYRGKRRIALVGDSITLAFPPELLNKKVLNQGISGESSLGLVLRPSLISEADVDKAFVMIGINDLLKGESVQSIINNIEKFVSLVNTLAYKNKTKVYIQSILPKALPEDLGSTNLEYKKKILNVQNKDVIEINNYLKFNQKGFQFIDVYSHLQNSQGALKKAYTTDGIHLSYEGYKVWASLLNKFI